MKKAGGVTRPAVADTPSGRAGGSATVSQSAPERPSQPSRPSQMKAAEKGWIAAMPPMPIPRHQQRQTEGRYPIGTVPAVLHDFEAPLGSGAAEQPVGGVGDGVLGPSRR